MKNYIFALFLCAACLYANAQNIALDKTVTMSSTQDDHDGHFIVDGKSTFATKEDIEAVNKEFYSETYRGEYQWIQIDLGKTYDLNKVKLSTSGLEFIYSNLGALNDDLILAVSNDPNFKGVYNPNECRQVNIQTVSLNTTFRKTQTKKITPLNNPVTGRYIRIWDTKSGGIKLTEVEIEGVISKIALEQALRSGNKNEANSVLEEKIRSGVDFDQEKTMRLAIDQSNKSMVSKMLSNDKTVSSEVFEYALSSNSNKGIVKTLLAQGDVSISSRAIKLAISSRDKSIVTQMMNQNISSFSSADADYAFELGLKEIGKSIIEKGSFIPTTNAVNHAIRTNDVPLLNDLLAYQATVNSSMLTTALKQGNGAIVDVLKNKVKANSEAFVIVARNKDEMLYRELTIKQKLPDNRSIEAAIDVDANKILKIGLDKGGDVDKALSYAISKNKEKTINFLLNRKDVDAKLAIDYAVINNKKDIVSLLIDKKNVDPNLILEKAIKNNKEPIAIQALETNNTNPTPYLVGAIKSGRDVLAKKIVEYGGDPDAGMEMCIQKNNSSLLDFLVNHGASVSNPKFMETAAKQNLTMVEILYQNGADVNNGVASASASGKLDVLTFLINEGAAPQKGIDHAIKNNKSSCAAYLLQFDINVSPPSLIQNAAYYNNEEIVSLLLEKGAVAQNGLENAIKRNAVETFKVLLANGANITHPNDLILATTHASFNIIPLLTEGDFDPNYTNDKNENLLHLSIKNHNSIQTIYALIEIGIPVNQKDMDGNTPIHKAAMKGKEYINTINKLAESGADVNALNNKKRTPRKEAKGYKAKRALKKLGGKKRIK